LKYLISGGLLTVVIRLIPLGCLVETSYTFNAKLVKARSSI